MADDVLLEAHDSARHAHWLEWRAGRQFGSPGAVNHIVAALRLELTEVEQAELTALFEDPDPGLRLRVLDGVADVLEALRSRGIRLGIVCDAGWLPGRVLRRELEEHGLSELFEPEALAFSDEVGVYKPHPDIFRFALRGLDAPAVRSAHVGDLRATDVAGARALGMATVRYTGSNDDGGVGPEADVVIAHHAELPAGLGL